MIQTFKTQLTKDIANKQLIVTREFAAPLEKVWDAWTKAELLEQWWAPRPWRAETKSMDFRVGGHWRYAMVSPEGKRVWSHMDYQAIEPHKSFTRLDMFCGEDGIRQDDFPSMLWHVAFQANGTATKVTATLTFNNEADIMKILEMGFEGGFAMAHGNLDELLAGQ